MAKAASLLEFKGFLSFLILHELRSKSLYGDELAKLIGKRRGGKLTPGTIYPALIKLRKLKFIKFVPDKQKKIYSLTPQGKKELARLYKLFGRYFAGLKAKVRK